MKKTLNSNRYFRASHCIIHYAETQSKYYGEAKECVTSKKMACGQRITGPYQAIRVPQAAYISFRGILSRVIVLTRRGCVRESVSQALDYWITSNSPCTLACLGYSLRIPVTERDTYLATARIHELLYERTR
jgi:hypothetical protein